MTDLHRFAGVFAAMVTPFSDDGASLSEERLRAYCGFLVARGVSGLFAFGTTGEWPLLSEQERARGARVLVEAAAGRVPVIVHAGAHSTDLAARLAAGAREAGADAVSVLSPPFFPLDDAALFEHFTAVARAVPGFPVFLYNIPEYAGNDISPDLLLRVASGADNVIGLKYSGDSLDRLRNYRRVMGGGFRIFNGNDSLALAALRQGADGLVSGNASCRPELLTGLEAAFREGRVEDAAGRQRDLDAFIAARDASCELSTFKALCALRGVPVGDVRPPLKRLADADGDALGRLLK
jgi:dihydrodipicolinate synthase/N-acetylneuraminate lyase